MAFNTLIDEKYFKTDTPRNVPIRYQHEGCSKMGDRTLIVTRVSSGWIYNCHRCGVSGKRTFDGMSGSVIADFAKDQSQYNQLVSTAVTFPPSFPPTNYTRLKGETWLMKFEISETEMNQYNIYWSGDRLVFPILDDQGHPLFWQARGFNPDKPKWINQKKAGRQDIYFIPERRPTTNRVVLVEDMVSCIKVNRVVDCIGLLGSYLGDDLILGLSKQYEQIVIWLDADKAEYSLGKMIRYQSFGINVGRIFTPVDPKYYLTSEITRIVEEQK